MRCRNSDQNWCLISSHSLPSRLQSSGGDCRRSEVVRLETTPVPPLNPPLTPLPLLLLIPTSQKHEFSLRLKGPRLKTCSPVSPLAFFRWSPSHAASSLWSWWRRPRLRPTGSWPRAGGRDSSCSASRRAPPPRSLSTWTPLLDAQRLEAQVKNRQKWQGCQTPHLPRYWRH